MSVLWYRFTQRSCCCVLLRKALQTGCFDEPGGEQRSHYTVLHSTNISRQAELSAEVVIVQVQTLSPCSPGHISLCLLIRITDLHMRVTQSLHTKTNSWLDIFCAYWGLHPFKTSNLNYETFYWLLVNPGAYYREILYEKHMNISVCAIMIYGFI